MAKILSIDPNKVYIGTDDKGIREVKLADFNFIPVVGDEVDIYETDTKIIVVKRVGNQNNQMYNTSVQPNPMPNMAQNYGTNPNGVNINFTNTQPQPAFYQQVILGKVVDKFVYCLLALLLGSFGIHKFYAGKFVMGILYLIFCWTWIPTILSIIDFIIGLTKPSDINGKIVV